MELDNLQLESACPAETVHKPPFRILIAWGENQSAFLQAAKLQDQVESLCARDFAVSKAAWNFSLLRHKSLRAQALEEFAESDLIIVSLGGADELPPHARSWMDAWPVRSPAGQTALVAMIGPEAESLTELPADVQHLQAIAEKCGLAFFCNLQDWEDFAATKPVIPRSRVGWWRLARG